MYRDRKVKETQKNQSQELSFELIIAFIDGDCFVFKIFNKNTNSERLNSFLSFKNGLLHQSLDYF
jgi:hypothetical protein